MKSFLHIGKVSLRTKALFSINALVLLISVNLGLSNSDIAYKIDFCRHAYEVEKASVCSIRSIEDKDVEIIEFHVKKTFDELDLFFKEKGFSNTDGLPLRIYIVPFAMLNDPEIFGYAYSKNTVYGRYYVGKGYIFISDEYGLDIKSTDLPHELSHYIVDSAGGLPKAFDELIAREFEEYYKIKNDL